MRILVTGGSGMSGYALQHIVGDSPHQWHFVASKDFDLMDSSSTKKMFETIKPDVVIHLAARVGGLFKNITDKITMFHDNVIINENVLMNAHNFGVQYGIFISSTCVFPDEPSSYPIDEEMLMEGPPHQSNDGYAYAKRMLVLQCKNFNECYKRNYICLSPCNLYGPNDNFNLRDAHVIPALIHRFHEANVMHTYLEIATGYDSKRQFLYSYDFATVIVNIMKSLLSNMSLPYHMIVCPNKELLITDVIHIIAKHYPSVKYCIVDKEHGQKKKTCSNKLIQQFLPSFDDNLADFDTSLSSTIQWFEENYSNARL